MADSTFYYPYALQDDVTANTTENGYLDVIDMLYSDNSINQYPTYPEQDTNCYDIMHGELNNKQKFTETLKIAIPSALRTALSVEAGGLAKTRNYEGQNDWKYRTQIRGLVTKIPGFYTSDYTASLAFGRIEALISEIQYR